MKTNKLFKTTLLLVALFCGASASWADGTISIPQDLGSYILIGNASASPKTTATGVTLTGCQVDGSAESSYTVGSTSGETVEIKFALTAEAGNYVFAFQTGTKANNTSSLVLTLTNESSKTVWSGNTAITDENANNWVLNTDHIFAISNLAAGDYTMTIAMTRTGSEGYGGNLGNFCFNKDVQFNALPLESNGTYLDVTSGSATTSSNPRVQDDASAQGGKKIGYITKWTGSESYPESGATLDNYYIYNNASNIYTLKFVLSYAYGTYGTAKIKVTITDVMTGTIEVNAQEFDVSTGYDSDNKVCEITNVVSKGLKKLRFDFCVSSGSCNFKDVTFFVNKYCLVESENYTPVAAEGVDVVLTRSITAGNWSTLCLPFNMTAEQVTATFGEGTKLATIGSYNSGTKVLTMSEATTITANVPCMIKVPSDFTSGTISGVTIETGTPEVTISGDFKFVGTYSKIENLAEGNYYVKDNYLKKATGTQTIKPFRAYFAGVPTEARLMFFDDAETTSIKQVEGSELRVEGYYNLNGQKVQNPTRGLYIVNGKKIVIK